MNRRPPLHRILVITLLLGLCFGGLGPIDLTTSTEAASPSASARIIKKLKKQIATLKKQLAAATAVPAPFIEMVPVGLAGNAADPGNLSDPNVYGAVNYAYSIGKYEVTLAQYTTFLNAVAETDPFSLYNTNMGTDLNVAGIARNGADGSYTYSVIGTGDHPVTYVSWFDAARFCNWLHKVGRRVARTLPRPSVGPTPWTGRQAV